MKFVDRVNEMKRLKTALEAEGSRLIVIYGRRRVGKSTLVRRVLSADRDIYFQADETGVTNQLRLLSVTIASVVPGFDNADYPDWYSLLETLNYRVPENAVGKVTLCLDEFPYLVKGYVALPSVIQRFWDTMSPRFNLILCGSSQQSMYSELLNEKSPLYGRADCIIRLRPIEVTHIGEAMELGSAREAVEQYSFWGGVPRYWNMCMEEGTLETGIRHLLLSPDGTLNDEPGRLMRDELRDLTMSRTLLSVIGNGANRMSEIAGRVGKKASELTAPLRRLVELGFVEREHPFGEDSENGKRSLYRLADPFMDAYFHFVAPNASLIASGNEDAAWKIVEAGMNSYVGAYWERICRRAVSGWTVDGVTYGEAVRWWGTLFDKEKGEGEKSEVDVVALSLDGKHLFVGECKWTAPEYAERLLGELRRKVALLPFAQGVEHIHMALFLREKPLDEAAEEVFLPEDVLDMIGDRG